LNFDTQAHNPNEFVELCERVSYGESTGSNGLITILKANVMEKQAKEARFISRNPLQLQLQISERKVLFFT
jgi:ribosomal protein S28E/S33